MLIPLAFNEGLRSALDALSQGKLVAFPTETVYALACDPCNPNAVDALYQIKQRQSNRPVSLLVGSLEMARQCASFNRIAERLGIQWMPGPLTLVLPLNPRIPYSLAPAFINNQTVGIRIPNHPDALCLLGAYRKPLIGTSVNISGESPLNDPGAIAEAFGDLIDVVLSPTHAHSIGGCASTVLDCCDVIPRMLREGNISAKMIENLLGHPIAQG